MEAAIRITAFAHAVAQYNRLYATVDYWPVGSYEQNEAKMKKLAHQAEHFRASFENELAEAIKERDEMRAFILDDHALDLDLIPKKWGGEME